MAMSLKRAAPNLQAPRLRKSYHEASGASPGIWGGMIYDCNGQNGRAVACDESNRNAL
jgi:hypothetical protein